MNRREALAALVSLPEVARISTVPAASNDVIVVECDRWLTSDVAQRIHDTLSEVWPGRKIVVLDEGISIKVAPGT